MNDQALQKAQQESVETQQKAAKAAQKAAEEAARVAEEARLKALDMSGSSGTSNGLEPFL